MKKESDRITFKKFLKMLRPGLRPKLANEELERFLRSMKRREIFNDWEGRGKSLEARRRVLPILDTPEHAGKDTPAVTEACKNNAYDPQAVAGNFWTWWDERFGNHPSCASDYAALKSFWAHWGTSLENVEALAQRGARSDYEYRVEKGFDLGSARYLKAEYDKWRQAETSRLRAWAAKAKAENQRRAKADAVKKAERIKIEKELSRTEKPHTTGFADVEKELDRRAFEDWQHGNFAG